MKKFLVLLLLPIVSFSQNKKDNTIVITDTTVTIENIRKAFMKEGFSIDKNEKDYVSTDVLSGGAYGRKLSALKDGDSILMKSWVKIDIQIFGLRSSDLDKVDWTGEKGGCNKVIFSQLKKVALSLSDKVHYIKQ